MSIPGNKSVVDFLDPLSDFPRISPWEAACCPYREVEREEEGWCLSPPLRLHTRKPGECCWLAELPLEI